MNRGGLTGAALSGGVYSGPGRGWAGDGMVRGWAGAGVAEEAGPGEAPDTAGFAEPGIPGATFGCVASRRVVSVRSAPAAAVGAPA